MRGRWVTLAKALQNFLQRGLETIVGEKLNWNCIGEYMSASFPFQINLKISELVDVVSRDNISKKSHMVSTKGTVTTPALQPRKDERSAFLSVRIGANIAQIGFGLLLLHTLSKFFLVTIFNSPSNKNYLRNYVHKTLDRTQGTQKLIHCCLKDFSLRQTKDT